VPGPPPLEPFGLVLQRDERWTHEGRPILNRKLREAFDRGVRFLPDEGKYVVSLGHFRAEIQIEETGFFVTALELETGRVRLTDGSEELLDVSSLRFSPHDAALVCTVKRDLGGLPARFRHSAQADLLLGVEEAADGADGPVLRLAGEWVPLPDAVAG
jgi:hypothetical protein